MGEILEFPRQFEDEEDTSGPAPSAQVFQRRAQEVSEQIKETADEQKHWQDEARAHEQKKNTCMALLVVAVGNDLATAFADLVSFGTLGILTAPVPGILRFIVASTEREQKPERLLRTVIAMALKTIPALNILPSTTFLMVVDLAEAQADLDMAKNKEGALGKKLAKLKNQHRQLFTRQRAAA